MELRCFSSPPPRNFRQIFQAAFTYEHILAYLRNSEALRTYICRKRIALGKHNAEHAPIKSNDSVGSCRVYQQENKTRFKLSVIVGRCSKFVNEKDETISSFLENFFEMEYFTWKNPQKNLNTPLSGRIKFCFLRYA